jgi:uncharacterized membrane protein YcfT
MFNLTASTQLLKPAAAAAEPASQTRHEWLDFAKGFCMLAVVMLYSANEAERVLGSAGWMQYWVDFAQPFRMPDFFLLSGLLLSKVINKPWRHYADRKIAHYLYFYLLWSVISLGLLALGGRFANLSPMNIVNTLIGALLVWPYKQLWFILMLPAYFLLTRLARGLPVWLVFAVLCLVHLVPPPDAGLILIASFFKFFVFFYAGYAFAPALLRMASFLQQHRTVAVVGLLVWIALNGTLVAQGFTQYLPVVLLLGFLGTAAVMASSALLHATAGFRWIGYLGSHTLAIYLPFSWMMLAASSITRQLMPAPEPGFFAAGITVLAILGSLTLYWGTRRTGVASWLFSRPRWARIAP